jgi:hypothetical protein
LTHRDRTAGAVRSEPGPARVSQRLVFATHRTVWFYANCEKKPLPIMSTLS